MATPSPSPKRNFIVKEAPFSVESPSLSIRKQSGSSKGSSTPTPFQPQRMQLF